MAYDFNSGEATGWDSLIAPYVGARIKSGTEKAVSIFACPSDSIARGTDNSPRTYSLVRRGGLGFANSSVANVSLGRALSEFPDTAATLMAAEWPNSGNLFGNSSGAGNLDSPGGGGGNAQDIAAPTGLGRPLHFDGWNYLFADGHVKWLLPESTVDGNPAAPVGTLTSPRGMWTIAEGD